MYGSSPPPPHPRGSLLAMRSRREKSYRPEVVVHTGEYWYSIGILPHLLSENPRSTDRTCLFEHSADIERRINPLHHHRSQRHESWRNFLVFVCIGQSQQKFTQFHTEISKTTVVLCNGELLSFCRYVTITKSTSDVMSDRQTRIVIFPAWPISFSVYLQLYFINKFFAKGVH